MSFLVEPGLGNPLPGASVPQRGALPSLGARGSASTRSERGLFSAIYEGSVTHHRVQPVNHRFTYPLYHLYLDLDELDRVFVGTRWWRNASVALATFRRQDYLPGNLSLADQARALVQERTGQRPDGAVRLLTHTRMFGVAFNPVSFFYCFSADGSLAAIIAEITNIPWLE